jgi:hypothetical protein
MTLPLLTAPGRARARPRPAPTPYRGAEPRSLDAPTGSHHARIGCLGAANRLRGLGSVRALARRDSGQATVEFVALLPLLLTAGLAGAAVLAGQAAGEHAGQAAQAGAMALQSGTDARAAARSTLPTAARSRSTIALRGRRITVRVRPRIPIAPLADLLTAEVTADAGPEPAP